MVQTPIYWYEEKFQPLVETETLYGNKVQIPEIFQNSWKELKIWGRQAQAQTPQEKLESFQYIKRNLERMTLNQDETTADFAKVMLETYKNKSLGLTNREALEILKAEVEEMKTSECYDEDSFISSFPQMELMVLMGELREHPEIIDEEFVPMHPNYPTPKDWVEE